MCDRTDRRDFRTHQSQIRLIKTKSQPCGREASATVRARLRRYIARPRARAFVHPRRGSGGGRRICHRTPGFPHCDRTEAAALSRSFLSNSRFFALETGRFLYFWLLPVLSAWKKEDRGSSGPTQRQVTGGGGLRKPAVFASAAPLCWCRNCALTGPSWGNDKPHFKCVLLFFKKKSMSVFCTRLKWDVFCASPSRRASLPRLFQKRERIQQCAAGWWRVFLWN